MVRKSWILQDLRVVGSVQRAEIELPLVVLDQSDCCRSGWIKKGAGPSCFDFQVGDGSADGYGCGRIDDNVCCAERFGQFGVVVVQEVGHDPLA